MSRPNIILYTYTHPGFLQKSALYVRQWRFLRNTVPGHLGYIPNLLCSAIVNKQINDILFIKQCLYTYIFSKKWYKNTASLIMLKRIQLNCFVNFIIMKCIWGKTERLDHFERENDILIYICVMI